MSREGTAALRKALDLIPDADHWTKGGMSVIKWKGTARETEAYCLLGALETATEVSSTRWPNPVFGEAVARVRAVLGLGATSLCYVNDLTSWNDQSRRRYAEVREALEKAIRVRSW